MYDLGPQCRFIGVCGCVWVKRIHYSQWKCLIEPRVQSEHTSEHVSFSITHLNKLCENCYNELRSNARCIIRKQHFPEPVEMEWRCGYADPTLSHCDSVRFGSIRFTEIVASIVVVDFVVDGAVRWMHGKTMRFLMKEKHTLNLTDNTFTHTHTHNVCSKLVMQEMARTHERQTKCMQQRRGTRIDVGQSRKYILCNGKCEWIDLFGMVKYTWCVGKGIAYMVCDTLLILTILWANNELRSPMTMHTGTLAESFDKLHSPKRNRKK